MIKNIWILTLIVLVSCNSGSDNKSQDYSALDNVMGKISSDEKSVPTNSGSKNSKYNLAVVLEAMDAGKYTYVRLNENGEQYWAAISAMPVEIGKTYAYSGAMMMKDFESKQLNRTFDSVMFIQEFMETATLGAEPSASQKADPHARTKTRMHDHIKVEKAPGGETIAGIYSNLKALGGSEITVKGQVVKVSRNIMNRNWIHIQDGTESGNHYDLTITTHEPVNCAVGDVVTFTGTLSVDKDFGAGYRYDAILENASIGQTTSL